MPKFFLLNLDLFLSFDLYTNIYSFGIRSKVQKCKDCFIFKSTIAEYILT